MLLAEIDFTIVPQEPVIDLIMSVIEIQQQHYIIGCSVFRINAILLMSCFFCNVSKNKWVI